MSRSNQSGRRCLLLTPEVPARTGNGLAMRAGVTLRALAAVGDVTVVVVRPPGTEPSEPPHDGAFVDGWASSVVLHIPPPVDDQAAARSWLAEADDRTRLAGLEPLSGWVRAAHPRAVGTLVQVVAEASGDLPFDLVHVTRLRMAPWAEPYLWRAEGAAAVVPRRLLLDLDDDEVATHRRLAAEARRRGEDRLADELEGEAQAMGRLADWYVPRFDLITVASGTEVAGVERHHPRRVAVVPNGVERPEVPDDSAFPLVPGRRGGGRAEPEPGPTARLLLVGNLTYAPNRWAAATLAERIGPALAARIGRPVAIDLVGRASVESRRLGELDGVTVRGPVDSLEGVYARADLVMLPLAAAGGTRIKVLEALAHRVPVVSTAAGVEGLGLVDGEHARVVGALGDPPDDLVDALVAAGAETLADPAAARARAERGRDLVGRFTVERVIADLVALLGPG